MEEKEISNQNVKEEEKTNEKQIEIEDKDKEAKREYLTKELIDKGYNPEDFSNYVSRTKGYSTHEIDIEIFKKLIEQFKTDRLKQQSEELKGSNEKTDQQEQ